jgi:hypothetical protein
MRSSISCSRASQRSADAAGLGRLAVASLGAAALALGLVAALNGVPAES